MSLQQCGDVVVIGGRGFIGRHLVRLLVEDGRRVRMVGRQPPAELTEGVTWLRGDVADSDSMLRAIEGACAVYHLAMGGGESWADFERDFVEGTRNVAQACLQTNVRRLVYTSSTSALYLGGRRTIRESDGADRKPHLRSFYARGKVEAERLLLDLHARANLPVVILRPAIVLGRGGLLSHAGAGFWPADTRCAGWGTGKTPLPFVLVEDVARSLFAALEARDIEGMTFNLAGDVRFSAREYVALVAERSHRDFRFYPRGFLRIAAVEAAKAAVKWAARKNGGAQSLHDIKSRSMRSPLDCSAAKQCLGWRPVSDRETFIREAIDCHLKPIPPGDLRIAGAQAKELLSCIH